MLLSFITSFILDLGFLMSLLFAIPIAKYSPHKIYLSYRWDRSL